MKLRSLHEAKDSLKHSDPDIESSLAQYHKILLSLGFKQKEFEHKGDYKFREDDEEAMAFFTDGILDIVVLVSKFEDELYRVLVNLELKEQYAYDGKAIQLANVGIKDINKNQAISILSDTITQLQKLEGFFDWILDVTGKHHDIKFKAHNGLSSSSNGQEFRFPITLTAIGGEYSFYAKDQNKRGNVF